MQKKNDNKQIIRETRGTESDFQPYDYQKEFRGTEDEQIFGMNDAQFIIKTIQQSNQNDKQNVNVQQLVQDLNISKLGSNSKKPSQSLSTIKTPMKPIDEYNEFDLADIRRIQIFFKKYLRNQECKAEKEAFNKKIKKFRYRMYQINELVQTEQNYVSNLQILINNIKKPLEEQNIITNQESQEIFCNIESIFSLNKTFLKTLLVKYDNNNFGPYSCIVDQEMLKIILFFKYYSEYFNNLENANRVLYQTREQNEALDKFLSSIEMTPKLNNNDLLSYLQMPFYRLFKYKLLFEDLLKKTDEDHPDYQHIQQAITTFHEVSNHNNEQMKDNLETLKLMDLQSAFGENLVIFDKNRKLLFDEQLYFLSQNQQIRVKVYFLNDLILITQKVQVNQIKKYTKLFYKDQQEQHLINHLQLNEQSFISGIKDGKYFQNIFKISGKNDSFTFNCDTHQQKEKIINDVKAIINNLLTVQKFKKGQQSSDMYPIHVNVLGTEERNANTFNKFTVYIVEVTVADFAYKIFIRYREMVDFEKEMKKQFSDLKFPKLETRNWFTNHKTKVIESRKLLIENFLQKVLSSEVVIKSDKKQSILERLGLPLQFYELPEIQKQPIYQLYQSHLNYAETIDIKKNSLQEESKIEQDFTNVQSSVFTVKSSQLKNQNNFKFNQSQMDFQEEFQFFDKNHEEDIYPQLNIKFILELSKKTLNRSLCIRMSTVFNISKVKMYTLEVQTIDKDIYPISVNEQSRTLNLREQITQQLKLKHSLDFRIFLIDSKGNMRVLDEEEQVMKIIVPQENVMQNKNIFSRLSITLNFTKIEQQFLLFKKYLWLPYEIENLDYKQDVKRLSLITWQIFDDISKMQFQLGFKEYSLYSSLYLYINYNKLIQNLKPSNFPLDKVKEIIPNIIYNANKEINWIENIIHYTESITKELDQIAENNKNQLEDNTQDSNIDIHVDKILLAQQVVLNSIKFNSLFGVSQYHVQTYRKTMKDAKLDGFNLSSSIWLGIKHDKIMFLTPTRKDKIREYFLEQLEKVTVFPTSIILGIKGEKVKEYRFNTVQSFEISQIIADYKEIKNNMELYGINSIINNQKN